MIYQKLTVVHNHGVLVLQDAVVFEAEYKGNFGKIMKSRYVKGVCVGGGQESRLFQATAYKPFETGVEKSWCIGSSAIIFRDGQYEVDATYC